MKKLATLILILALILVPAARAEIDLSGMSFDELVDLQRQVTAAIMQTDEWQEVEVPAGYYEVGVDIPAGRWTIAPANYGLFFCFYESLQEALDDGYAIYYEALEEKETYTVIVKEGMGLQLTDAAIFTPYAPAFSFK